LPPPSPSALPKSLQAPRRTAVQSHSFPSWGKVRHISRTSWDTSPEAVRHISRSPNGTPQPNFYRRVGTPCRIRTCDLVLRRHPLWSTELRGRGTADYKDGRLKSDVWSGLLLVRCLRQRPRGEPAQPLRHHDRGQDDGAVRVQQS